MKKKQSSTWPRIFSFCAISMVLQSVYAQAATPEKRFGQDWEPTLSTRSVERIEIGQRLKRELWLATQKAPEVLEALALQTDSAFAVEGAKEARYPRFSLGTQTGRTSGRNGQPSENYRALSAQARLTLLDAGTISARIDAAESNEKAAAYALEAVRQDIILQSLTAYLELQRFSLKKEISEFSAKALAELAQSERKRVALGGAGRSDMQMAMSRQAAAQAKQSEFSSKQAEAMANFERLFGFTPKPEQLPLTQIVQAWRFNSLDEALSTAYASSAQLMEVQNAIEQVKAQVRVAEASRWPALEAVMSKVYDPQGRLNTAGAQIGVELNWALGSGFELQRRVQIALNQLQRQEARYEGIRRVLQQQTGSVWTQVVPAQERERNLAQAADTAQSVYLGRKTLMDFGRETLFSVLEAQLDYLNSMLDRADAFFDARINEIRLARTTSQLVLTSNSSNQWLDEWWSGGPRADKAIGFIELPKPPETKETQINTTIGIPDRKLYLRKEYGLNSLQMKPL